MGTPREKLESDLVEHYGATPEAVALVGGVCDLYEAKGVLPGGMDEPLYDVCPCCSECWSGRDRAEYPPPEYAGVSAPFIGAGYVQRRICVVGINLNHGGGLQDVWYTCGLHIEAHRAGRQGVRGKPFAYGAMSYARLVDAALDGRTLEDWANPTPQALVPTWDSCAFVEAVKCAPRRDRGTPYAEMESNCPRLLLRDELAILKPRVVILLSRGSIRDQVRPLLNVEWDRYPEEIAHPNALERDRFTLGDDPVELFCCNHPSSRHWLDSLRALRTSLEQQPLM